MLLLNLLKEFLKSEYCNKVMKKHFNKNVIMTEKEEEQFQSSKTCWICEKLIADDDKKVKFIVA